MAADWFDTEPEVTDDDGEVDEVQADAYNDPDAVIADGDNTPLNLTDAPAEFTTARPVEA